VGLFFLDFLKTIENLETGKAKMPSPDSGNENSFIDRIRHTLLGPPRNVKDASIFQKLSLIPILAWIGLGADGLSSSAYGPEEAFKALGEHTYF